MNILFTICGRAGSKGIKNKNIRDFLGKPLPYYTVSAIDLFLSKTKLDIDGDIVVNTDSPELITLMKENKMREIFVIERTPDLGGDLVSKQAVIRDCRRRMEAQNNKTYDFVVDVDITSPLRTCEDFEKLFSTHIAKHPDITTTVVPARRNPYFNQVCLKEKGYNRVIASEFVARQQAPDIFDMNASIYAYSPEFLSSDRPFWDSYIECVEMYDTGILDLDHENDFSLMEVIAKYLFEEKEEFREIFENIR